MRIAICDDEYDDLLILKNYCSRYNPDFPVFEFTNGESLLDAFENNFYDLVFLDIEMGNLNGLEAGKELLQKYKPVIVFTTHSLNYAVRGYGIAIKYLPKPISYDMFCAVMQLALDRILPYKVSFSINGCQKILATNEIMYFEVYKHQIVIHLQSGETINTRGSLSEIILKIPKGSYSQPHKSYYINLEYIDKVSRQEIVLTNGDTIPIGRGYKDEFNNNLISFMKGNHVNEYLD